MSSMKRVRRFIEYTEPESNEEDNDNNDDEVRPPPLTFLQEWSNAYNDAMERIAQIDFESSNDEIGNIQRTIRNLIAQAESHPEFLESLVLDELGEQNDVDLTVNEAIQMLLNEFTTMQSELRLRQMQMSQQQSQQSNQRRIRRRQQRQYRSR